MAKEFLNLDWSNFWLALVGGLLPAIFWLWFWLQEDKRQPEPKRLLLTVFLTGGLAVLPAFVIQRWLLNSGLLQFNQQLGLTIIVWALIEETLKYAAAGLIAFRTRYFDEPVDALVYLITAALGFAAVENILFGLNSIGQLPGTGLFWLTGQFRFVGATLLHVVASAVLGGFIALAFCRRRAWDRVIYLLTGLVSASLLHAGFNYSIINASSDGLLKIFIWLWAITVAMIFFFEIIKTTVCADN